MATLQSPQVITIASDFIFILSCLFLYLQYYYSTYKKITANTDIVNKQILQNKTQNKSRVLFICRS